ncbi:MAG: Gfo/Idh/MocA family oxidoreductase [Clostridiales bacterium]|jgi:predicted dehydrogenase|nr:Gfo/Idh/MocA family oxidoreductase [Clostridiales bacterium]
MEKVKVGIIGCGVIARLTHGPEYKKLSDRVEIVAACDIIKEKLDSYCDLHEIPKRYTKISDLLADKEIQAVDVCLHNNMHSPVAIEAMRRGKDVYSEKPMAGSYVDAVAMIEASKKYGRKLHVQLAQLYSASSFVAKRLIENGDLGKIYHMRSTGFRRRGRPYVDGYGEKEFVSSKVAGGGALLDMGVYHISQLLYLTGNMKPVRVVGNTYQEIDMDPKRKEISGYDVEELITGMIDFGGGVTMDMIESWAMNLDNLEGSSIIGSKGGVRLSPFSYHFTKHDVVFNATMDETDLNFRSSTVYPEQMFYRSSQGHWAAALRGECELLPTAEIALNTQLIQESLYLSNKLGRQVTTDEVIASSVSKNTEVVGLYE